MLSMHLIRSQCIPLWSHQESALAREGRMLFQFGMSRLRDAVASLLIAKACSPLRNITEPFPLRRRSELDEGELPEFLTDPVSLEPLEQPVCTRYGRTYSSVGRGHTPLFICGYSSPVSTRVNAHNCLLSRISFST